MKDFINPKSMLTPGAAGALVMFLSNSICLSFPEFAFRYVALALSLLVGAIVFAAEATKILNKIGYWIINSLIIFAMGVGTSNIGANLSAAQGQNTAMLPHWPAVFSEARAQSSEAEADTPNASELEAEVKKMREEIERLKKEKDELAPAATEPPAEKKEDKSFFRRW